MKKLILSAALVLAGATAFSSSAMAQDFTSGDLILSFRLNTNTGNDLEVDLGSPSSFTSANSYNNVLSTLGSDLNTVFGSNWNSNTSLVWSVVAVNGTSNNLYVSDPNNATTISATSPQATTGTTSAISGLYSESAGTNLGNGAFEIALSSTDGTTYSSVLTNYNGQNGNSGNPFSGYNVLSFNSEANVSSTGTPGASFEYLYTQTPAKTHPTVAASSTSDGYFELLSNGTLEFNPVAAPEPSTYALFGLGALALVFARRRFLKA